MMVCVSTEKKIELPYHVYLDSFFTRFKITKREEKINIFETIKIPV